MAKNSSDNVVHLDEVIVAMVPFPDFSHLNQLFVLARFIASYNIPVHFLCLADRNQDLKLRVQGGLRASNLHFHDLLVPSSLTETEDAGAGMPPIVIFMKKLVEPIGRTCSDLSTKAKRLVIIQDSIMMSHIRDVHSLIPKVESYMFHCISAFARYSMLRQSIDHIVDDDHHEKMIKQMHDEFPLLESCSGPYAAALVRKEHEWKLNSGEIMNTLFIFLKFSPFVPMATNSSDNEVTVAMVPFPEYSHLNQLFVLARFVASHNIPVHLLCLADQSKNFKQRIRDGLEVSNIHFDDLQLPSETEDTGDTDNNLPPIAVLLKKLTGAIFKTCVELSTNARRLVIIHDNPMRFSMGVVLSFPNVESYIFHADSAFIRYSLFRQCVDILDDDHDKMLQQLQDEFPTMESCFGPYMAVSVKMEREWRLNSGEFINSCKEVEGKYLDLLAKESTQKKPLWAIGPIHMLLLGSRDSTSSTTRHECLAFLDKQEVNSILFVSFGTNTKFSQEQVNEIALGLERSNHKFIWVLREADKKTDTEKFEEKDWNFELPEGFQERVEGRGMVV